MTTARFTLAARQRSENAPAREPCNSLLRGSTRPKRTVCARTPAQPQRFSAPPASNSLLLVRTRGTETSKHRLEQITVLRDPVEGLATAEIARPHSLRQLLPAQRRRDRRPRLRSYGVD